MIVALDIDHTEIERRKALYRRVFDYQRVDHLPVFIWLQGATRPGHTIRWELESGKNQLEANLTWIERSLRLLPDDYIPVVRITQGYMTIASMFGCQVHWSEDPNQPPGVLEHPIKDFQQVYQIKRPGVGDGMMPENLRRMRFFAENLPPDVSLTGVDIGGPLNSLKDLVATNLFYTSFYDDPKAVHALLDLLTSVQLEMMQALVIASGGNLSRFGCLDFDPVWHPEKYISFSSDDVSATIGPKVFKEFSMPYNDRLYAPWGSGGLHNCGPHPCREMYVRHKNPVKYLNCSHHFTHKEYPALRQVFAGWGVIEPMFDLNETAEEMLAGYREMMENLAPDTLAIPICVLDKTWSDDDIIDLYHEMRKISEEYARAMRWLEPEPQNKSHKMPKNRLVLVTDIAWPSTKPEEEVMAPFGARLVLAPSGSEEELLKLVPEAEAILTNWAQVPASVLRAGKHLKVISRYGIGVDNIAVAEATHLGIPVTNVPEYCLHEVSEHALALLLASARKVCQYNNGIHTGNWKVSSQAPVFRLFGKILGIVGFGRIARTLVPKASALGLHILVYDPFVDNEIINGLGCTTMELDDLLRQADFVSIHAPLTDATRGLINAQRLRLMKPTAFLINTSRGAIIDQVALAEALSQGWLAGAALDVFVGEPLSFDHPLLTYSNVIATPHVSFYSEESLEDLETQAAENVVAIFSGKRPASVVNPEVLNLPRWAHLT